MYNIYSMYLHMYTYINICMCVCVWSFLPDLYVWKIYHVVQQPCDAQRLDEAISARVSWKRTTRPAAMRISRSHKTGTKRRNIEQT